MDYSQTVDDSSSSFKAGIRYALARWRERETLLIEKYSVLGRFVNPPKFLFALVIVLAVLFRVASLFAVSPGNAPDEFGHLVIALALSQPEVLTLKTEHNYSPYPYAIYDPLAYFPAAAMLHAGSKIDKTLNRMSMPMRISDRATYLARAGMLIWAAVFLVFLAKSAHVHRPACLKRHLTSTSGSSTDMSRPWPPARWAYSSGAGTAFRPQWSGGHAPPAPGPPDLGPSSQEPPSQATIRPRPANESPSPRR